MIDIHTHLLPACDDGSPDFETSLELLDRIAREGVTDLFLTPHYFLTVFEYKLDQIKTKFRKLEKEISSRGIKIRLHLGAEIYLDDQSYTDVPFQDLTMGKSGYMLIETNMNLLPDNLYRLFYNLVKDGYKPILAHPERYSYFRRNINLAEEFMHRNIYLQINAGSLLGVYGKTIAKTAWQMLEQGYAHFLASDDHSGSSSYFLSQVRNAVVNRLDDYTFDLLTRINPGRILKDQPVEFFYLKEEPQPKKNVLGKIFETLFKG